MNYIFVGTIKCDFEADWCQFAPKTEGDDASKNGFEWMRHNGKWIQEQSADGPIQGKTEHLYSFSRIYDT